MKFIIFLSIFCFLVTGKICAQTIKIHYHSGCDCGKIVNGEKLRGGCVTNARMEYHRSRKGKYFASKKLRIEVNFRQYENRKWGENLLSDSLKIFRFNKKINSKDFNRIISYINLVEELKNDKRDSFELRKQVISKWDKNTFELNQRKIRRIKKVVKKENESLKTDSLIQRISEYLKEENRGIRMSSLTEFLNIFFEYNEKKYSLSQNYLGGANVSWQIRIDEETFLIISPELNKMIYPLLTKKMSAKKRINEFLKIKELQKALKTQSIES